MDALFSGTVTFLLTDIEGSTALAQQYPDAIPILRARHQTLVHEAVERKDDNNRGINT